MLPPGIYVWNPDGERETAVFTVPKSADPTWVNDLSRVGAWSPVAEEGLPVGSWFRVDHPSGHPVVVVESCASTMEVARELVDGGVLAEWGAVVAIEQNSGRGQLRRPWYSPSGNLHMSLVLPKRPKSGAWNEALSHLLPLVCGYVFCEVLAEVGAELEIKWPNDLLQKNRKVGGMLIEERGGTSILGLGMNLADCPPREQMREDSSVEAATIQISNEFSTPLPLLELLVNRGEKMYDLVLGELMPQEFIKRMSKRLAWFGRTVIVNDGRHPPYQARIAGLSPEGGLVLSCRGEESVLYTGSVVPL